MKRPLLLALVPLAGLALAALVYFQSGRPPEVGAEITALQTSENTSGYPRASRVRPFTFPLDYGPHPEFQTEWWYYTGNLAAAAGRHFGYQLTFFRRALSPDQPLRASDWATNQIYFAHFALTDVQANDHFAAERFSRGAAGLAGASGDPYRVWIENWSLTSLSPDGSQVQLAAVDAGHALSLTLASDRPLILHGDAGLSQKTAEPGNASYYFSFTHLRTEGTLVTDGSAPIAVAGLSWMDHEFGTTGLGAGAVGWDWFSVQLGDNRQLMFFQIREKDGSLEPLSSGTLVEADGTVHHLTREQVQVRVLGTWKSDKSGGTYPARWSLAIPSANLDLTLRPFIPDQEMRISFTYWEGAVEIGGTSNGVPVGGSGYVEMTGYAGLSGRNLLY